MRISSFLKCFAIVGMATLASCSKDDGKNVPDVVQGAFTINGQKYNTLQDAVNAVMSSKDENAVITLTASTSGDGFTVKDGIVNIDFGSNMYYLNPGKTLSFDGSIVSMTGKGGELVGEGTIIKGNDSGLSFEGNLNVEGDMDVTEMDYFGFVEDYSGVYSGSVNLKETYMYVEADKAELDIETLNPVNSTFNVIKAKSVTIDNVVKGTSQFPVCSAVAGVVTVKNGGEAHVHSYGAGVPALCSSPELMAKECSVCGDIVSYIDETNTKVAACHADLLEHHAAVEATDTEWGNVEYWECGICGRFYADKDAQKPQAAEKIKIAPKTILNPDDFAYEFDEAQTRAPIDPKVVSKVVDGVSKALEVINAIATYIEGEPSTEEVLMDKFLGMDRKLDEILNDLKEVKGQLTSLGSMVLGTTAEVQLNPRLTDLKELEGALGNFHAIYKSIKEHGLNENEELEQILENWNGTGNGRSTMTQRLASNYGSMGAGLRGVDDMWKDVLRSRVTWEHEGYGAREVAIQQDASIIQYSAVMAACYIRFVKHEEGSSSIETDLTALKNEVDSYDKAIKAARELMKDRAGKYVVLSGKGTVESPDIVFNKAMGDVDAYQTLKDNKDNLKFVYKGHNTGCNAKDTNIGIPEKFDEQLILTLMSKYQTQNPMETLRKSGFTGLEGKFIVISLSGRPHYNVGRQGFCANWHWKSDWTKGNDYVYFRGSLCNYNCKPGEDIFKEGLVMNKCNIDEDNGKFTGFSARFIDIFTAREGGYYRTATIAQ